MFFLKEQIQACISKDNVQLILFNKVLNVTKLVHTEPPLLTSCLLRASGTDISHWFDPKSRDFPPYDDPVSNRTVPLTPNLAPLLHVHDENGAYLSHPHPLPWWKDPSFVIGHITVRPRRINFLNMLTHDDVIVTVCSEETLLDIHKRLQIHNAHCLSYTWKYGEKDLDMNKTLEENGVEDVENEFEELGLDGTEAIPTIRLYFNDDLTVI
ncbi:hypothetical protein RCL1_003268 [Eukaryota sp. TZLM3-RCL]